MPRKRIGEYTQQDADDYIASGWRNGWIGRQTPLGLAVKVILAWMVIAALAWVIDIPSMWAGEAKRIVSPTNVRKTWSEAYKLDRHLQAQARIVCRTAQSSNLADTVSGPPLLAAQSVYDNMQADYSQLVSNKLEGGLVLPPDLHSIDKTLTDRLGDNDVGCPQAVINKISGGLK